MTRGAAAGVATLDAAVCARNGCQALADETLKLLMDGNMTTIFQSGLHEFLADFIARNNRLGQEITEGYRFYS